MSYHRCLFDVQFNLLGRSLINLTNQLVLFCLFCIHVISTIDKFSGRHYFYVSNHRCFLENWIHAVFHWSIKRTKISILLFLFYNFTVSIINPLKGKPCFWRQFLESIYFFLNLKEISFWVLVFIKPSLIVDMFVLIDWIRIHWSWYMSWVAIVKFLWYISKLGIWICFHSRLDEGHGKGSSYVFILVHVNLLFWFIWKYFKFINKDFLCWLLIRLFELIGSALIDADIFPCVR